MKLHQLKKGDKFKLEGGVGNVWTFVGTSGMPSDVYYLAYDEKGKMQYFIGYIEVTIVE